MPKGIPRNPRSHDEWVALTENARRFARFKAALERAEKIVATEPPLTDDQLRKIEAIFADARSAAAS